MGPISAAVVFFLTWWITIFAVLPWGLKRDERGMPNDPNIKKKFLITTGIAVIIWLVICAVIQSGAINFREMADALMQKDYGS